MSTVSQERTIEILRAYLRNDYDDADPAYVRNVLTDICHVTVEEAEELGILDLFTDKNGHNSYMPESRYNHD